MTSPKQGIAGGIGLAEAPESFPGAEIGPADIHRHHRGALRLLHHRIVDRDRGGSFEGRLVQAPEIEVGGRGLEAPPLTAARNLRRQTLRLLDQTFGGKDEHPAVPGKAALLQIALGGFLVRLLDEPLDALASGQTLERFGAFDVAVARFRPVRRDAEGDQPARLRRMPPRAATPSRNASRSAMWWSEGSSSMRASGSRAWPRRGRRSRRPVRCCAPPVRPGWPPPQFRVACSVSATRKRCSSLQRIIGAEKSDESATRARVRSSGLSSPISFRNCLG